MESLEEVVLLLGQLDLAARVEGRVEGGGEVVRLLHVEVGPV